MPRSRPHAQLGIVGRLRGAEPGRITLGGSLHIIVPPDVILPDVRSGAAAPAVEAAPDVLERLVEVDLI